MLHMNYLRGREKLAVSLPVSLVIGKKLERSPPSHDSDSNYRTPPGFTLQHQCHDHRSRSLHFVLFPILTVLKSQTAAPISKMPPELLAKIFWSTKEDGDLGDLPFRMYDIQESGYAIATVCRVW